MLCVVVASGAFIYPYITEKFKSDPAVELLASAETALSEKQWEKAVKLAEKTLQLQPENLTARDAVQKMFDLYIKSGKAHFSDGRIGTAELYFEKCGRLADAFAFLERDRSDDLKGRIAARKKNIARKQESERQAKAELTRQIDKQAKQNKIARLLNQAEACVKDKSLTTPPANNAKELYQKVLALEPNNPVALAGFRRIADEYYDIAVKDAKRFKIAEALDWISMGLAVFEQHENLLNLKSELKKAATALEKGEKPLNQDSLEAAERYARNALKSDYYKNRAKALISRIEQRNKLKIEAERKRIVEIKRKREEEAKKKLEIETKPFSTALNEMLKVVAKDGRYIAYEDGTVYDKKYKLWWAATDNGADIKWDKAKIYCEQKFKNGGWRMPTTNELRTLYDANAGWSETACGWDVKLATSLIKLTCNWVWAAKKTKTVPARYSECPHHA